MMISLVLNRVWGVYNILKKRYEISRWKYSFVYKVRELESNIYFVINVSELDDVF